VRPARRDFRDKQQLAEALAETVAATLKQSVKASGLASLAVSGGSTPTRFFNELSQRGDVPWSDVTLTLVDERWVGEESDRSNARLVRQNLFTGRAALATFVPLYQGGAAPDTAGIARTNSALARVPQPLDIAILGMGNDGHTASFFPGGDTLHQALTADGPSLAINAPGAGEPRVTLTLKRLLAAHQLILHIEGREKAETLDKAMAEGPVEDMPIRAILRQSLTPLTIYWCP
jgi:6-phosphogluconolactonase